MAELHIQPKKSAPSPWLLVVLAIIVLALAAYFFLRPDPADTPPVPAATPAASVPATDTLAPNTPAADARATPPADNDSVTRQAAAQPAAASPTRTALLELSPTLTQLTDRPDLRDDASVREQRDNFTSATARLADGDPQASLRPGLVAAASLLLAIQQKAYPNLEAEANGLLRQANSLSGRDATPAEQTLNKEYLAQLSELANTMSYPARDVL
ncbi:hypothetical protein HHL22_14480 [Hymenobacter sp. RP-2-7]|uniref:Uncharacterized protein n=1 Tax=Hymenobacter polaris TaxID=2682546 RepID=A0A7Y0AFI4_9BACT|nr:hypothetical protein [Hymenobacter polaris]NML66415.1 hypothetical protein [Hymenobacter polaris]